MEGIHFLLGSFPGSGWALGPARPWALPHNETACGPGCAGTRASSATLGLALRPEGLQLVSQQAWVWWFSQTARAFTVPEVGRQKACLGEGSWLISVLSISGPACSSPHSRTVSKHRPVRPPWGPAKETGYRLQACERLLSGGDTDAHGGLSGPPSGRWHYRSWLGGIKVHLQVSIPPILRRPGRGRDPACPAGAERLVPVTPI